MISAVKRSFFLQHPVEADLEKQYKTLDNGLIIGQKRVPMGVIGIIFEARPNVTADAFGLCLKAGSATILRGGKEAFNSNTTIVNIFREALENIGLPKDFVPTKFPIPSKH